MDVNNVPRIDLSCLSCTIPFVMPNVSRFLFGASRRHWTGCVFSPSVRRVPSSVLPDPLMDRKMVTDNLWREFFSDPSKWWDHRSEKVNPRYPDFKHKKTHEALWLIDKLTPPWVESQLAKIVPGLLQPHIFSWHVRLRKHVKAGDYRKALNLFQQMQREGMILDKFTFVPVLSACSNLRSLEEGRRVHEHIIQRGCESDVYVANSLIHMYARCGSIEAAWSVFDKMWEHDLVSWNAMIRGYVKSGQELKAMELFRQMEQDRVEPDAVTFVGLLNACASVKALEEGRRVHEKIIQNGCESDVYVANSLLDMYAKCGSIVDAWRAFNKMPERDVVSWNTMIGGCVKSDQWLEAMDLLCKMQQEGVEPNAFTFVGVLNGCASVMALEEGRRVHEQIIQKGYQDDVYVATCLVVMYAKCGSIEDAWSVFDKMGKPDLVLWNAMVGAYVKSGQGLKAIELFRKMQQEGMGPNTVTFVGVLNACASVAALEEGRRVHEQIIQRGCESDVYVATCLIDMYGKCGSMEDAWSMFIKMRDRNVVSWNAMIGVYVKYDEGLKAIELFQNMQQEQVEPNAVTFLAVLNACASVLALEVGRRVHEQVIQRGCESDVYIANCLVDMYAKCGSIGDALRVFNKMQDRNVVSWSAMISGYGKSDQGPKAIELFREMQQEGVEPNTITFVGVLNACASVAAVEEGRHVHELIIQRGWESDVYIANSLIDMYAKCGSIGDAWSVFSKMQERNVVSWTAMIGGYGKSEQGLKAIELFRKMQEEKVEPNAVTFVGMLTACASVVALEEGRRVHEQIIQRGWESDIFVATCLVDMYAKCGTINHAWSVFNKMRQRKVITWNAMIGGYARHGHSDKAVGLFKQMVKEGVDINHITFTCILSACSNGGLVKEGLRYFNSMTACYNVLPTMEHYACMIDLLGRAGLLVEAEEIMMRMSMNDDAAVWMSRHGACRINGNNKIVIEAAKQHWVFDPGNASANMLLSSKCC